MLNNAEADVEYFIDSRYRDDYIFVHPNDNTASVLIRTSDLIGLIEKHGNTVRYLDLLQYGGCVRAVEPEIIKKTMNDQLDKMVENYNREKR